MKLRVILIALLFLAPLTPSISATPPKAGAICSKAGVTKNSDGKKYTCVKSGKKLVWNKGIQIKSAATNKISNSPSPTPSPLPGMQTQNSNDVRNIIIRYHRPSGDYAGWNIWIWRNSDDNSKDSPISSSGINFEGVDSFGAGVSLTVTGMRDFKDIGFILRQGDWITRDIGKDRFITNFDSRGFAEIWLIQGDENVYTSKPNTTSKPSPTPSDSFPSPAGLRNSARDRRFPDSSRRGRLHSSRQPFLLLAGPPFGRPYGARRRYCPAVRHQHGQPDGLPLSHHGSALAKDAGSRSRLGRRHLRLLGGRRPGTPRCFCHRPLAPLATPRLPPRPPGRHRPHLYRHAVCLQNLCRPGDCPSPHASRRLCLRRQDPPTRPSAHRPGRHPAGRCRGLDSQGLRPDPGRSSRAHFPHRIPLPAPRLRQASFLSRKGGSGRIFLGHLSHGPLQRHRLTAKFGKCG
ncbi:MAG: hypothetical protein EBW15_09480, partial [Actinobacteria bacterium]|nr:hypothetical protein [Actinomycetota bacterium]